MKILAVTSGRADASPLRPVIEALRERGAKVATSDLEREALFICVGRVRRHIDKLAADVVLLLGDRYEILAAALAATVAQIPIAHIHGGEASFGSFDNQIRDAITKLSHIHFVSNITYEERLVSGLSESRFRVHVVGAPGLDNIARILKEERKPGKYFVVTWHPETLGDNMGCAAMAAALKQFPDYKIVWTGVNNDPGADKIRESLQWHDPEGSYVLDDMTPTDYLRAVYNCAAVIGNSSSGIIEAPALGVPTVNIGCRQEGRQHGPSVFDAKPTAKNIEFGINWALGYNYKFTNPYGTAGASAKIADILMNTEIEMVKRI